MFLKGVYRCLVLLYFISVKRSLSWKIGKRRLHTTSIGNPTNSTVHLLSQRYWAVSTPMQRNVVAYRFFGTCNGYQHSLIFFYTILQRRFLVYCFWRHSTWALWGLVDTVQFIYSSVDDVIWYICRQQNIDEFEILLLPLSMKSCRRQFRRW